jgi:hypothetical protein
MLIVFPLCKRWLSRRPSKSAKKSAKYVLRSYSALSGASHLTKIPAFPGFFARPAAAALNFALLRVAASVPSHDRTPNDQAPNHQTPNRNFCAPAHVSIPSANNSASVQPMPKSQTQSSQRRSAIRRRQNSPTFCALSTLVRKANPAPPCVFPRKRQELTHPLRSAFISVHLRLNLWYPALRPGHNGVFYQLQNTHFRIYKTPGPLHVAPSRKSLRSKQSRQSARIEYGRVFYQSDVFCLR